MGGMMQAIFHGGPFDGERQVVHLNEFGERPIRLYQPSRTHPNVCYVYKLWVECGTKLYYKLSETLTFDEDTKVENCNE